MSDNSDNSKTPEIIRLLDSSGSSVLDSVSTEYEDSFCLETFGDLIKSADSTDPKGTDYFLTYF
jgi:hypothetical protein